MAFPFAGSAAPVTIHGRQSYCLMRAYIPALVPDKAVALRIFLGVKMKVIKINIKMFIDYQCVVKVIEIIPHKTDFLSTNSLHLCVPIKKLG